MRAMESTVDMNHGDDHHHNHNHFFNKMNNNNHLVGVKESPINTWHPHVYASPPKTPTPHLIADILGWTTTTIATPIVTEEPLNLTTRSRSPGAFVEPINGGIPHPLDGSTQNGHITTPPPKPPASRRNSTHSPKGKFIYLLIITNM